MGPIRPMAGGGHLGPLSYVYGYRGGIGRRGVGQDTTGDDGIKIRARVGRHELILWRCAADFVPKSAILRFADVGQRKNGRSGGKNQTAVRRLSAVLGGMQSGWEQFGAVKKYSVVIGRPRCQLNGLYLYRYNYKL